MCRGQSWVLGLLVLLGGCGPESVTRAEVGSDAAEPAREPERVAVPLAEASPLVAMSASVAAGPLADGTPVAWVYGFMSCGFMELARGEATVVNGRLEPLTLPPAYGGGTLLVRALEYECYQVRPCDEDGLVLELHVESDVAPPLSDATPNTWARCWVFAAPPTDD